jgi:CHAT domain-containing protein
LADQGTDALIILPDGPLHLLPFASLQDEHGKFLIEKAPIAVAPSRSTLYHTLTLARNRTASDPALLLIDGSANLPHAREEMAGLLKIYGMKTRLLAPGGQSAAGKLAGDSEIIHFAGHSAVVQGKPVLLLQASPVEVFLDSATISTWKLPRTRLVYLAGCSTGIGPQAEGETPWGLIPAFLSAGAPAIVASLLPVDDAATRILTSHFYELLHGKTSNAAALQKAQVALLDAARASGNLQPQSWAPYILVGNPR